MSSSTVIWPTLRYADAREAIRFLIEAFGFEEVASYPGATEDVVAHAELRGPNGGGVMLGSASRSESAIAELPAGVGSIYSVIEDPDTLFAQATAAGATVVRELTDQDYGSREFTVRDPEGVFWSFGTYGGAGSA
ncbi:MAG TPA: VOC family protein [Frankiaceae bacterium]|nr:VOC family protein [Frankiaceae bacterium]